MPRCFLLVAKMNGTGALKPCFRLYEWEPLVVRKWELEWQMVHHVRFYMLLLVLAWGLRSVCFPAI